MTQLVNRLDTLTLSNDKENQRTGKVLQEKTQNVIVTSTDAVKVFLYIFNKLMKSN